MTIQVIAFIAGSIFILIAVIGGGFTIKELTVPTVPKAGRIGSGAIGVVFIIYSLLMTMIPSLPGESPADERSPDVPSPSRGEAIYADDEMAISPNGIRVSGLQAVSRNDPPRVNDRITVHFSLQNVEREPVTLNSTFIGARDPVERNIDFGHENYEKVLAPDEVIDIKSSIFVTERGEWEFWPCYKIRNTFCPNKWRAFRILVVEPQ